MRAIAIIMVVLCHLSVWGRLGGQMKQWAEFHFSDATAVFVFISGFLFKFLADKKGFSFPTYIKTKLKNVGLPYLFFISIATVIGLVRHFEDRYGLTPLQFTAWNFTVGGVIIPPLWFVPMIFIYFLTSSLWYALSNTKYFSLICIILLSISLASFRPFNNANPLLSFIHFAGFFSFGILMASKKSLQKLTDFFANKIQISTIIFTLYLAAYFLYITQHVVESDVGFSLAKSTNYLQIGKVFFIAFLLFFTMHFYNKKIKILSYIANISFGLFFVHGFYLIIFNFIVSRWYISNNIAFGVLGKVRTSS